MAKSSNDKIIWFGIGAIAMYFLKDHVQGIVGQVTGSMRARSYYATPRYPAPVSYHTRNRRGTGLRRFQQFY